MAVQVTPPPGSGAFSYSADKRALVAKAQEQVRSYDVYQHFPNLPDLAERQHVPRSVLVTGAAGFIASHVAIRLVRLYPQLRVVGLDKVSYCSDVSNVLVPLAGCGNFRFVQADICDHEALVVLMREEKIDTVLHLAAQSHVDLSLKEGASRQFARDNVEGTASMLEASRKVGVRRFVHCSTDEVYGEGSLDSERVAFTEQSPLRPTNPYSASKAGAELLAQSFHTCYGLPLVVTRGNNVYGPHQFYEKVIPKFIAQLLSGRQLTIHGAGGVTRNFLHVQDTASAFDTVLHCGVTGEVYNIGGRNEKSVLDVASDLLLMLGLEARARELVQHVADRAHNDACYPIRCEKLYALGWRESLSWEFGLANSVAFYTRRLARERRDLSRVLEAHPHGYSAADAALAPQTREPLAAAAARARL